MKLITTLIILAGLLAAAAPHNFNKAFQKDRSLEIQTPDTGMTFMECELPPIPPKKGFTPVLRFNARILTKEYGGWNHYMTLSLNGKQLGKYNSDGQLRLLFRGEMVYANIDSWAKVKGREWWTNNTLLAFFAPLSAEELDPRFQTSREEGFIYHLDISDCADLIEYGADDRIENEKPNRLKIGYGLLKGIVKDDARLIIKDINVVYVPNEELAKSRKVIITEHKPGKSAAKLDYKGGTLQVNETGGMEIIQGKDHFFLETRISFQAKPEMGFNKMGISKAEGEQDWKPVVKQVSNDQITVTAKGASYTIQRTVTRENHRFKVTDKIANTTGNDLGFAFLYDISTNNQPRTDARLAGLSNTKSVEYYGATNPTVYAPGENGTAVALLAEDSLSRAQMALRNSANVLTMGSDGTGLPANDSIVREWAIYPQPANASYYTFINQVRRDWNVNMTIPGPIYFDVNCPKGIQSHIRLVSPWFEYAGGAVLNREEYTATVKPIIEKARKENPNVRVFGMLETNLVPFNVAQYDWKHELPLTYGDRRNPKTKYGIFLSPKTSARIDAITPYKDSIIRDANGCVMIDNYYIYGKREMVNLMVQPEADNYRVKTFMDQIDFLIDKAGFDSIYIDQFFPGVKDGISDNRWDGRTVTLNKDGSISGKRYKYSITGAEARMRIVQKVRSKGGIVLVNGSPVSREVQASGLLSFQEQENSNVNPMLYLNDRPPETISQVSAHLAPSPSILLLRPAKYSKDTSLYPKMVTKGIICALRNGVLFFYYTNAPVADKVHYGIGNHLFPFTPVELNEGFLVGRERTVTAISGNFTLKGKKQPILYHFDEKGFPKDKADCTVTGSPDNWKVSVKLNDWNEVSIFQVQN